MKKFLASLLFVFGFIGLNNVAMAEAPKVGSGV